MYESNSVRVIISISDGGPIHQITLEIQGEEINIESCVEELQARATNWAISWLKYPGFEVTIKSGQGEGET